MLIQPQFVLLQPSSFLAHWVKHTSQTCPLNSWLSGKKSSPWMRLYTKKNVINITLTVLLASPFVTSKTNRDCSGAWFLNCTQKSMSHYLWWLYKASLVLFEDSWWYPDTPLYGTPDYHSVVLATILHILDTQIFDDIFPNAVLFHVQLSWDHLNSQSTIALSVRRW